MTLGIDIGGAPLGTNFPAYHDDPAIHDGSLLLIEPGHSLSDLAPGAVPTAGYAFRNHAFRPAARLLGLTANDEAAVRATLTQGTAWGQATRSRTDRTAAGALQFTVSRVNANTNVWAKINAPANIVAYANSRVETYAAVPTKDIFFAALWTRTLRAGVDTGSDDAAQPFMYRGLNVAGSTYRKIMGMSPAGSTGYNNTGNDEGLFRYDTPGVQPVGEPALHFVTARFVAQALQAVGQLFVSAGNVSGNATHDNKSQSFVFERLHFGTLLTNADPAKALSPQQMLERELAEWTKAHAAGGRYFNDPAAYDVAGMP